MKRFFSLLRQDLTIAYRSGHILITGLLLAIMLALVVFLPKQVETHQELLLDTVEGHPLATHLAARGTADGVVFTDQAAFEAALAKAPMKMGIIFSGSLNQPHFTFQMKNQVADANLGLLQASLDRVVQEIRGDAPPPLPQRLLRAPAQTPPFNLQMIPIMLVFEVVLLGFLIAAVMMFQEKQEATIQAYRVTPAGTLAYLLSKNALFGLLSLAYGLPILLVGFGLQINYALIVLVLLLSSSLMTMFSLAISVFYRNLSEWFFAGLAVLMINSLPMISYGFPSFAPGWMTWIPSYPAVFAVRDVLFAGASLGQILPTVLYLTGLAVLGFAAAAAAVHKRLLKEGR